MTDPMMVAQGLGFIRRSIELDIEEKKAGAEQELEWFTIIEDGITAYRRELQDLQSRILSAKISLK